MALPSPSPSEDGLVEASSVAGSVPSALNIFRAQSIMMETVTSFKMYNAYPRLMTLSGLKYGCEAIHAKQETISKFDKRKKDPTFRRKVDSSTGFLGLCQTICKKIKSFAFWKSNDDSDDFVDYPKADVIDTFICKGRIPKKFRKGTLIISPFLEDENDNWNGVYSLKGMMSDNVEMLHTVLLDANSFLLIDYVENNTEDPYQESHTKHSRDIIYDQLTFFEKKGEKWSDKLNCWNLQLKNCDKEKELAKMLLHLTCMTSPKVHEACAESSKIRAVVEKKIQEARQIDDMMSRICTDNEREAPCLADLILDIRPPSPPSENDEEYQNIAQVEEAERMLGGRQRRGNVVRFLETPVVIPHLPRQVDNDVLRDDPHFELPLYNRVNNNRLFRSEQRPVATNELIGAHGAFQNNLGQRVQMVRQLIEPILEEWWLPINLGNGAGDVPGFNLQI